MSGLSPTDARAIVVLIDDINAKIDVLIQKQVELNALLCAQVESPVDNRERDALHREAMGTNLPKYNYDKGEGNTSKR